MAKYRLSCYDCSTHTHMGGILAAFKASHLLPWTIRFILVIPPTPMASLKVLCNHTAWLTFTHCLTWIAICDCLGRKGWGKKLWALVLISGPQHGLQGLSYSTQIPWKEKVSPHGHSLPRPPYLGDRLARSKRACFDNIFTGTLSDKLNSREGVSWFHTNTEHKWKRTWCSPLRQITS